jgi:hypothetical protein
MAQTRFIPVGRVVVIPLEGMPMIGEAKCIQGVIQPAISGETLRHHWENRADIAGTPLAALKTDGKTFEIRYLLWDTENLKYIFLSEIQRLAGPSVQIKWTMPTNPIVTIPIEVSRIRTENRLRKLA